MQQKENLSLIKHLLKLRRKIMESTTQNQKFENQIQCRHSLLEFLLLIGKTESNTKEILYQNEFILSVMKNLTITNSDELMIEILRQSLPFWDITIQIMFMKHTLPILRTISKVANTQLRVSILTMMMDIDLKSYDPSFRGTVKDEILKIILIILKSQKELKELALVALSFFQPLDYSISQSYRRTDFVQKIPQPTAGQDLPQEYEKIFTSQTDISSRMNDSAFQPFDNKNFLIEQSPYARGTTESLYHNNTLSITQVVDQKKYNQEIIKGSDDDSIINSSFFKVLNSDSIQKPQYQMESIYRKFDEPNYFMNTPRNAQTLCDEELKAELRDQVQDLQQPNKNYYSPICQLPQQIEKQDNINFQPLDLNGKARQNQFQEPILQQPNTYNQNVSNNIISQQNQSSNQTNFYYQSSPPKSRFVSPTLQKQLEKQANQIQQRKLTEPQTQMKDFSPLLNFKSESTEHLETIRATTTVENQKLETLPNNSNFQMRHSSFVQDQNLNYQKKSNEIFYSQMVKPQRSQKNLTRVIVSKQEEQIDSGSFEQRLQQFSRNVQSPPKSQDNAQTQRNSQVSNQITSYESQFKRSSQPIFQTNEQAYQSQQSKYLKNEKLMQQGIFKQTENNVKFQRTQPKALLPDWQKSNHISDNRAIKTQSSPVKQDDMQVLCVICEDLIQFEDVDVHSKNCLAKSKHQAQTQNAHSLINDDNKKLEQLKQNFQIQSKLQYENSILLAEILDKITKIIQCSDSYKQLQQLNNEINQYYINLQQNFDQTKYILILTLQRIISIAQKKQLKMQFIEESVNSQTNDESTLRSNLNKLELEVQIQKKNYQKVYKEFEILQQIEKEDLENMKFLRDSYIDQNNEVLSQFRLDQDVKNSETKTNKVTNSVVSDFQYQKEFEGNILRKEGASPTVIINEDQKKTFFQLAVSIKLNLPHNHPGKNLIISDAYEKALLLNIQKHQWEKFLYEEMKNQQM